MAPHDLLQMDADALTLPGGLIDINCLLTRGPHSVTSGTIDFGIVHPKLGEMIKFEEYIFQVETNT